MIKRNSKSGQSILEYTLLLGVIIVVIVVVLLGTTGGGGGMKKTITDAYNKTGEALNQTATNLTEGLFR